VGEKDIEEVINDKITGDIREKEIEEINYDV
jgi:hypothetical protein